MTLAEVAENEREIPIAEDVRATLLLVMVNV
jgi:hypothetical protein